MAIIIQQQDKFPSLSKDAQPQSETETETETKLPSAIVTDSKTNLEKQKHNREKAIILRNYKPLKDTPKTRYLLNLSATAPFPSIDQQIESLIKCRSLWTPDFVAIATRGGYGAPRVISTRETT